MLTYKVRLYLTCAQAAELDIRLGAFYGLCNAALQRNEAYRRQGKTLRHTERARDLRAVRDALVERHTGGAGNYLAKRMDLRCNSGPISFGLHDDAEGSGGEPICTPVKMSEANAGPESPTRIATP